MDLQLPTTPEGVRETVRRGGEALRATLPVAEVAAYAATIAGIVPVALDLSNAIARAVEAVKAAATSTTP